VVQGALKLGCFQQTSQQAELVMMTQQQQEGCLVLLLLQTLNQTLWRA
jgi:hypothetical protein